jgi:3-oxoadipate enol-lactonase
MTSTSLDDPAGAFLATPPRGRAHAEFHALVGDPAAVLAPLAVRTPQLAAALEAAFDDVLAEPGLPRQARELATLAALTALGGSASELDVHTRAALRVGVDPDELRLLLHHLLPYLGFPRILQAAWTVSAHLPAPLPEIDVDLGDHTTAVIDRPGDDPTLAPLVLVHALGLNRQMWRDTIAALPTDRRVLAYDLRGHDRAADAPRVIDLEHFATDLERLLDVLGLPTVHLTGLSLGGSIAQVFGLTRPSRLVGLDLIATVAETQPAFAERAAAAERDGMAGVLAGTLTRWFTPAALAVNGWPVRYARDLVQRTDVCNWAASWRALAGVDTLPRLGTLDLPVRVIAGELDPSSTPAGMRAISDAIPGAEFVVVPGAPHMLSLERPTELAALLARRSGPTERS